MEMITVLETGGAVMLTIGILEAVKRLEVINVKFIPLLSLLFGILICGLGSTYGIIDANGWSGIVWNGLMTGLMACGLFSGVKNTLK